MAQLLRNSPLVCEVKTRKHLDCIQWMNPQYEKRLQWFISVCLAIRLMYFLGSLVLLEREPLQLRLLPILVRNEAACQ